jgi:hypothetical protein
MPLAPYFDHSRAYLIGIADYSHVPVLITPVKDVEAISTVLGLHEFSSPVVLLNSGKTAIESLLARMIAEIGPRDRVLFYFAGHGIARDSEELPKGFLIPADAKRDDEDSFIDMNWLLAAFAKLPCKHLLVILDCCFAGAIRWSEQYRAIGYDQTKKLYREKFDRFVNDGTRAWQVITSASYDEEAIDRLLRLGARDGAGMEDNSPFAALLITALKGGAAALKSFGDGIITATRLYDFLDAGMAELLTARQLPSTQSPGYFPLSRSTKGQFIFLQPSAADPIAALPHRELHNPYKGLSSFSSRDSYLFFGREKAVRELKGLFTGRDEVLVVSGASGVGKSSLVMAGILPRVSEWLPGLSLFAPIRPGSFKAGEDYLAGVQAPYLIFIDQFEEMVSVCTVEQRDALNGFLQKALLPGCRLIVTVRSDFEGQFRDHDLVGPALKNKYVVPPLQRDEIRDIITQPAWQALIQLEAEDSGEDPVAEKFIDRIADEAMQTPGSLPLLSFALEEWYIRSVKESDNQWILKETAYKGIGGVNGALSTIVDDFSKQLNIQEAGYVRALMLRMVSVSDGRVARKKVLKADLDFAIAPVPGIRSPVQLLQQLIRLRVVTTNRTDDIVYYEPAHDSVLTAWPQLLNWINAAGMGKLSVYQQLAEDTRLWKVAELKANGNPLLWHNSAKLAMVQSEFEAPADDTKPKRKWLYLFYETLSLGRLPRLQESARHFFNKDEVGFIRKSILRARRNQSLKNLAILFLSVLSIVAISFYLEAGHQRNVARAELVRNRALYLTSQSEKLPYPDALYLLAYCDSIYPGNSQVTQHIADVFANAINYNLIAVKSLQLPAFTHLEPITGGRELLIEQAQADQIHEGPVKVLRVDAATLAVKNIIHFFGRMGYEPGFITCVHSNLYMARAYDGRLLDSIRTSGDIRGYSMGYDGSIGLLTTDSLFVKAPGRTGLRRYLLKSFPVKQAESVFLFSKDEAGAANTSSFSLFGLNDGRVIGSMHLKKAIYRITFDTAGRRVLFSFGIYGSPDPHPHPEIRDYQLKHGVQLYQAPAEQSYQLALSSHRSVMKWGSDSVLYVYDVFGKAKLQINVNEVIEKAVLANDEKLAIVLTASKKVYLYQGNVKCGQILNENLNDIFYSEATGTLIGLNDKNQLRYWKINQPVLKDITLSYYTDLATFDGAGILTHQYGGRDKFGLYDLQGRFLRLVSHQAGDDSRFGLSADTAHDYYSWFYNSVKSYKKKTALKPGDSVTSFRGLRWRRLGDSLNFYDPANGMVKSFLHPGFGRYVVFPDQQCVFTFSEAENTARYWTMGQGLICDYRYPLGIDTHRDDQDDAGTGFDGQIKNVAVNAGGTELLLYDSQSRIIGLRYTPKQILAWLKRAGLPVNHTTLAMMTIQ